MDEFSKSRVDGLHKALTAVMVKHIYGDDTAKDNDIKARLTDVAYVLCSILAMHLNILLKMGHTDEEGLMELTNRTIKDCLAHEQYPEEALKDFVTKAMSSDDVIDIPKDLLRRGSLFNTDDFDNTPPQKIKELTAYVANEVLKTLRAEGLTDGNKAVGAACLKRDDAGKATDFILSVKFSGIKKEG